MIEFLILTVLGIALYSAGFVMMMLGGHGNINGNGYQLSFTVPFILIPTLIGQILIIYGAYVQQFYYHLVILVLWHGQDFLASRVSLPQYLAWVFCGVFRNSEMCCFYTKDITWSQKLWYGANKHFVMD